MFAIPAMGEPHFQALVGEIREREVRGQVAALDQMSAHTERVLYQLYQSEYQRVRLAVRRNALWVLTSDPDPDVLALLVVTLGEALAKPAEQSAAYTLLDLVTTLMEDPMTLASWAPAELADLIRDLEGLFWRAGQVELFVLLSRTLGGIQSGKVPRIRSGSTLLEQRLIDHGKYLSSGQLLVQLRLMARVSIASGG